MFSAFIVRELSAKVTTPVREGPQPGPRLPVRLWVVVSAFRDALETPRGRVLREASRARPQEGALFCCFTAQNMCEWNVFLRDKVYFFVF